MNKSMKKLITHYLLIPALLLLSVGVWSFANAATYHVRKDGNDTACNGSANASSSSTPNCSFLTVQKGLNSAQAGDTVSVHAGDYSSATINSVRTGTASARITISGAGDGTATLGKTNILAGHNYITMSGLQFAGFSNGTAGNPSVNATLIDIKGTYFEYTNNYMRPTNAGSYGYALGIRTHAAYTTISNSTFEAGTVTNGPSFFCLLTTDEGGDYMTFTHNIVRNMIDVERIFELWAKNPTYSNNEIYNIKSTGPSWSHPDIWQAWDHNVSNFLAENNYIHDLQSQIGNIEGPLTNADATAAQNHVGGPWVFRNNVFANVSASMFIHTWKFYFYNNTFFNVTSGSGDPIGGYYKGADNFDVKNNAFVGCGGQYDGWYSFQSGSGDHSFISTLSYGAKSGLNRSEVHLINGGNPMFVNAKTDCVNNICDFHIAANSVLIDNGTSIAGISADGTAIPASSTDKDGNPRAGTWDIGAYEYGSVPSLPIMPPSKLTATPQ